MKIKDIFKKVENQKVTEPPFRVEDKSYNSSALANFMVSYKVKNL